MASTVFCGAVSTICPIFFMCDAVFGVIITGMLQDFLLFLFKSSFIKVSAKSNELSFFNIFTETEHAQFWQT